MLKEVLQEEEKEYIGQKLDLYKERKNGRERVKSFTFLILS